MGEEGNGLVGTTIDEAMRPAGFGMVRSRLVLSRDRVKGMVRVVSA